MDATKQSDYAQRSVERTLATEALTEAGRNTLDDEAAIRMVQVNHETNSSLLRRTYSHFHPGTPALPSRLVVIAPASKPPKAPDMTEGYIVRIQEEHGCQTTYARLCKRWRGAWPARRVCTKLRGGT